MAMTTCKECGSEVSDKAAACPRCGVSTPGGSCSIVIDRVKSMAGRLHRCVIQVDGANAHDLAPGDSVTVDVSPGNHTISAEIDLPGGKKKRLNDSLMVSAGAGARYEIKQSTMAGYKLTRVG